MSVWLSISLIVIGLVLVALVVLATDVARGDVGGGRHTMERARRVLLVATDEQTSARADRWVSEQRALHPTMQCFTLVQSEGQQLYIAVEETIERERPDAVIMARHEEEHTATLAGTFGRLKDELRVPVDAIYLGPEERT